MTSTENAEIIQHWSTIPRADIEAFGDRGDFALRPDDRDCIPENARIRYVPGFLVIQATKPESQ